MPLSNQEKLNLIADKIKECQKCSELVANRTQTVPGTGNPSASIVFLGEGPGRTEDEEGIPFCGKAGELLNNILAACGIKREDVFILNICKCRPPNNRTPLPEEAQNCRAFLDLQLKVINPQYIVCLGACAAQNLLNTKSSISSLRRQWFKYGKAEVLATFHPAFLLRNPNAKQDVWEDMQLLLERVNGTKLEEKVF